MNQQEVIAWIRLFRLGRAIRRIQYRMDYPETFGLNEPDDLDADPAVAVQQLRDLEADIGESKELAISDDMLVALGLAREGLCQMYYPAEAYLVEGKGAEVLELCFETAVAMKNLTGGLVRYAVEAETLCRNGIELAKVKELGISMMQVCKSPWPELKPFLVAPSAIDAENERKRRAVELYKSGKTWRETGEIIDCRQLSTKEVDAFKQEIKRFAKQNNIPMPERLPGRRKKKETD